MTIPFAADALSPDRAAWTSLSKRIAAGEQFGSSQSDSRAELNQFGKKYAGIGVQRAFALASNESKAFRACNSYLTAQQSL